MVAAEKKEEFYYIEQELLTIRNLMSDVFNNNKNFWLCNPGQKNWITYLCYAMGNMDLCLQNLSSNTKKFREGDKGF